MKDRIAPLVGVFTLVGFALLVIYMLWVVSATEVVWARAVFIFAGVEAIAFTAAGFFFGTSVSRERVQKAEERADSAEEKAEEVAVSAIRGEDLALAIVTKARSLTSRLDRFRSLGDSPMVGVTQSEMDELADLAGRLFPRVAPERDSVPPRTPQQ